MAKISIFIFGLDRVGKTTIVEFLKEKKYIPQNPTIGVSISQIVFQNLTMEFTDVGGQKKFRADWDNYLKKPHVLVFVIDASDRDDERIQEGRMELHKLLENPKVIGIPILILINKVDLSPELVMTKDIIVKKYGTGKITGRDMAMYEVSAKTGKNLDSVLNAMTTMVLKDEGIEYFVNETVKKESKQLLERYKKFFDAGNEAYKIGQHDQALASLNIAKEIATNLFQLGVFSGGGKDYKKLTSLIAKIEKEFEEIQQADVPSPAVYSQQSAELPAQEQEAVPEKQETTPEKQEPKASPMSLAEQLKTPNILVPSTRVAKAVQKKEKAKKFKLFVFGTDQPGIFAFKDYLVKEKFASQVNPLAINMTSIVFNNVEFLFNNLVKIDEKIDSVMAAWNDPELIIFMVDAVDVNTFSFAKRALMTVLAKPETKDKPLLVLVNNFDATEAQPVAFVDKISELKHTRGKDVGIYQVSVKYDYNLDEPFNFLVTIILKDVSMKNFVSGELKRRIDSMKSMYDALIKEAKSLEKAKKWQETFNRVAKAKLIQEELFKYNQKAQKEIKVCEDWLSKLRMKSIE
nr:ADP-ribosylation factor-like protein [Candidatus Sigynarchaeota archaeon]